jgi:hypothetical protein
MSTISFSKNNGSCPTSFIYLQINWMEKPVFVIKIFLSCEAKQENPKL